MPDEVRKRWNVNAPDDVRKRWNMNANIVTPSIEPSHSNELKPVVDNNVNNSDSYLTREQVAQLLQLIPKGASNVDCRLNMAEASNAMADTTIIPSMLHSSTYYVSHHWIIDIGATNHMTCHRDWLIEVRANDTNFQRVTLPNGQVATATHIGHRRIAEGLMLKNVLLIPCFQYNLILVSQLCRDLECSAVFHPTHMEFHGHLNGKTMGTGRLSEDFITCGGNLRKKFTAT